MKGILFLFCMFLGLNLYCQNNTFPNTYRLSAQSGLVFPTNRFLGGQNALQKPIDNFGTLSFSLGKQTRGSHFWQQDYNYPFIGMGVYVASFREHTLELGVPIAIYGFFSAPFIRKSKFSFNYELQLGYAFNWNAFNPVSNPNNISIGAKQSVYVDLGLHVNYLLTKNISIELGGSLSHFSNGALKKPNYGINTAAPRLSLAYTLGNSSADFVHSSSLSSRESRFVWDASFFLGITNVVFDSLNIDIIERYEGVNFPTYGASSTVGRKIGRKSKIGLGFTLGYHTFYNAVVAIDDNELEREETPISNKLAFSVFPSYELVVDRVSILIQPSVYLYRSKLNDNNPKFYQRLGIRYHINKNFFVGANLRAFDFHVSDFIEWTLGYTLNWDKDE